MSNDHDETIHETRASPVGGPTPRQIRRGVIGILRRGDEYLMIRRAPGVPKGGTWCFPGGHVDPGENARRAVVRELAEELGIVVAPTRRLGAVRVSDTSHILAVWRARHIAGEFQPAESEISDMAWMTLSRIATVEPGLPSNRTVAELLGRDRHGIE